MSNPIDAKKSTSAVSTPTVSSAPAAKPKLPAPDPAVGANTTVQAYREGTSTFAQMRTEPRALATGSSNAAAADKAKATAPKHDLATLNQLRLQTDTQLQALSREKLSPQERQQAAAKVIQTFFADAQKAGFIYQPKPNGGTSLLDEAVASGGKYQVSLGAEGHYDCTEAAIEAQRFFSEAGVPSKLEIIANPGGTKHALLDLGGRTFDATRALTGTAALGPGETRPVEASFSADQVQQLFVHGGSQGSARAEAQSLGIARTAQLKADFQVGGEGGSDPAGKTGPASLDPSAKASADADYDAHCNPRTSRSSDEGLRDGLLVELLKEHQGDGSYTTELIARAKADGMLPGVVRNFFSRSQGVDGKLDGPYLQGTDGERAAFTSAMQTAADLGYVSDAEVWNLGKNEAPGNGWDAVRSGMGITSEPAAAVAQDKAAALEKAQADAKDTNNELNELISRYGGGMTDGQKQEFIAKFKEEHHAVYDQVETAAKDLADYLSANKDEIYNDAASSPDRAKALEGELADLSTTAQASQVHDMVVEIGTTGGALSQQLSRLSDFQEKVIEPAEMTQAGKLVAERGGNIGEALETIRGKYEQLSNLKDFGGSFQDVKTQFAKLNEYCTKLSKGEEVGESELKSWLEKIDDSPGGKVFKGLGVMLTAASCVNDVQRQDFQSLANDLASTGEEGMELVSDAIHGLDRIGAFAKLAESNPDLAGVGAGALKLADFGKRFVPVLGAVVSGFDIASRLGDKKNFNAGDFVAIVGDALGLMGAGVAALPGGQLPGEVFDAIGGGLAAAGSLLHDFLKDQADQQAMHDEAARLFDAIPDMGAQIKNDLLNSNRFCMEYLAQMGLSGEQVSQLADETQLFNDPRAHNLVKLASAFGFSGDGMSGLLSDLGANGASRDVALGYLLEAAARTGGTDQTNQSLWMNIIHEQANNLRGRDPASASALDQVVADLKSQQASLQEVRDGGY